MIRVLLASRSNNLSDSNELENAIRSSLSIEFAGRADLSASDFAGDILLMEVDDLHEQDWRALAELPIPVLLLARVPDPALVGAALRTGIRGVILADATAQEIESAVHAVNAGLVVMAPDFLPEAPPAAEELLSPLSERELEVLDLLAEGLSNKLIAHRLSISEHTVKTHVASIFAKLGATSRTEAVWQAIRRGLVML
ncbi:MAG: DNA-binding response regulator [Bryobacteraceae bacterium]